MVRLKEVDMRSYNRSTQFQFHYGTIKSPTKPNIAILAGISIPLWYD